MGGRLYVGTSGFAFDAWKGPFYPVELASREMLRFYASRLGAVEINYTFRRHPSESTLAAWSEQTPEGFAFCLKAHQQITHRLRLAGAGEAVAFFMGRAALLGDRLGPVLFQCPPYLRHAPKVLEEFLGALPAGFRYAFEFRHPSWEEARPQVEAAGAAWCVADTDEASVDDVPLGDGSLVYLRLRRSEYGETDLRRWAARVGEATARGADVFCFFKHEDEGIGPRLALRLAELAGA